MKPKVLQIIKETESTPRAVNEGQTSVARKSRTGNIGYNDGERVYKRPEDSVK